MILDTSGGSKLARGQVVSRALLENARGQSADVRSLNMISSVVRIYVELSLPSGPIHRLRSSLPLMLLQWTVPLAIPFSTKSSRLVVISVDGRDIFSLVTRCGTTLLLGQTLSVAPSEEILLVSTPWSPRVYEQPQGPIGEAPLVPKRASLGVKDTSKESW